MKQREGTMSYGNKVVKDKIVTLDGKDKGHPFAADMQKRLNPGCENPVNKKKAHEYKKSGKP